MPKHKDDLDGTTTRRGRVETDLSRRVSRLARLDARPVSCVSPERGTRVVLLVRAERVMDPRPIVAACYEHGAATFEALSRALDMPRPPLALEKETSASLRRDLTALTADRVGRRAIEATPRRFPRVTFPVSRWL
jgi:hypothetical protein